MLKSRQDFKTTINSPTVLHSSKKIQAKYLDTSLYVRPEETEDNEEPLFDSAKLGPPKPIIGSSANFVSSH